jgi:hypothetical protein
MFSEWLKPVLSSVKPVSSSEKQLLQRCRGDASQLERLIKLELTRRAGISRADAASAALDRWSRDR